MIKPAAAYAAAEPYWLLRIAYVPCRIMCMACRADSLPVTLSRMCSRARVFLIIHDIADARFRVSLEHSPLHHLRSTHNGEVGTRTVVRSMCTVQRL